MPWAIGLDGMRFWKSSGVLLPGLHAGILRDSRETLAGGSANVRSENPVLIACGWSLQLLRNAVIGSILEARRAGKYPLSRAMTSKNAAIAA